MSTTLLQALIGGLTMGGIYALIALGFSLTYTTTRTLNFAQGDFVSVGAFVGLAAVGLVASALAIDPATSPWAYVLAVLATFPNGLFGKTLVEKV
ncbi:branched-chain amino acid ABC transporter permease [Bordetella holmesii]|uniref:ABC transporter permease subunit n=1 Tax=Bordetella holmesii TaxID=35814 RepID=UPI0012987B6A|nr:branched-chain amino acid ABC transporter permease [Bordetella holmesii]QGB64575.1 branched-chain amino acid ABC transporter permease [Bordetella holmesii]